MVFEWKLKTPIVLIVFNRPEKTAQVLEAIRRSKPHQLFVIADGPRPNRIGEEEKCAAVRNILNQVDWDCEVLKNYSENNLGCARRVSSGLDWVFELVDRAIILEDDCLPTPSFFRFCDEMLNLYQNDERIMMVSGTNILSEWKSHNQSYHFSYYGGIWGWATWRRAWNFFDFDMPLWSIPEVQDRIKDIFATEAQYKECKQAFDASYSNQINAWGYRWRFARLVQSGLSVVPSVNLVSNIGFDESATNTKTRLSELAQIQTGNLEFPMRQNPFVIVDREYDLLFYRKNSPPMDVFSRMKRKMSYLMTKYV